MKFLKSTLIFFITIFLPEALFFVFFEQDLFFTISAFFILGWGAIFVYLDKFILMALGAREVTETDEHDLFQALKNQSYKNFESVPKVYLYTGIQRGCIMLEQRSDWSLVIDRNVLDLLKQDQVSSFVELIFTLKHSNKPWLQTKMLGIIVVLKYMIYGLIGYLNAIPKLSFFYKSTTVFFICLLKPIILPLELLAKSGVNIELDQRLDSFINQLDLEERSYSEHIVDHFVGPFSRREWIISYLEGFSLLKNYRFNNEY